MTPEQIHLQTICLEREIDRSELVNWMESIGVNLNGDTSNEAINYFIGDIYEEVLESLFIQPSLKDLVKNVYTYNDPEFKISICLKDAFILINDNDSLTILPKESGLPLSLTTINCSVTIKDC